MATVSRFLLGVASALCLLIVGKVSAGLVVDANATFHGLSWEISLRDDRLFYVRGH